MHYICCQPAQKYYTWQVELMVNNFMEKGIPASNIHIVCGHYGSVPSDWLKLQSHYPVNFYFYADSRGEYPYIPSIYFHLMHKFLVANPAMQKETLFLHDCDILFTKPVDFSQFEQDSKFYLSDTNSYINYDYVVSKGEQQFLDMCKIVGISPEAVKEYNLHSGGGQYICKNLTPELFIKTEQDSIKLYEYLCRKEPYYIPKSNVDYPIQKWTAGMWALLWNIWLFGNETIVHKDLNFIFGTDKYEDTNKVSIYHNAGVDDSKANDHFFKGNYIDTLPFNSNLQLGNNASKWYYEQIQNLKSILV